jgi:2-oxoglutarate ferredoxin oxidoreductase subunit alpha
MTKPVLMTGNEAIAEGAIQAGCRFYAGYPITPQNEITAYMAKRMPQEKGVFIQAESEISAVNMVLGAAAAGARAMTSSSSPGISLKQEGISYLAGCQLPAVIVNIMRGGPGLGNISPSQSDYFQAVKGGGHGDYHSIVLAPSSVQEAFDFMKIAFDLADEYRTPAIILGDGMLGQMMEPLVVHSLQSTVHGKRKKLAAIGYRLSTKKWALTGCKNRKPNIIRSLLLKEGALEELNNELQKKYSNIRAREVRCEAFNLKGADIVLVAYGTTARLARSVCKKSTRYKLGLIRPITLWPFPTRIIEKAAEKAKAILVIEMSAGQMLEDVKLAVCGKAGVEFLGRTGGGIPTEEEIIDKIRKISASCKA